MKKNISILIMLVLVLTSFYTAGQIKGEENENKFPPAYEWPNAKMHYPQEPDPNGWDVNMSMVIGDDWECNKTGEITDITFWISWAYDNIGEIPWLNVSIWDNMVEENSRPGSMLWSQNLSSSEFSITFDGTGDQGFYWENDLGGYEASNHNNYYRVDINNIQNPFNQTSGTMYWLVIETPQIYNQTNCPGWKTTNTSFGGHSVLQIYDDLFGLYWDIISIGEEEEFYDLAFVIQGDEGETPVYNEFYVNTTYDATTPGWQTTHFDTIQDAVDACVNFYNYTIHVDPGVYNENVIVDEDSFDSLVIYGNETGTRAQVYGQSGTASTWEILDDNVILDGFYIENPGATTYHGVFLDTVTNVNVTDCFVNQSPANGIYSVHGSHVNIYDCLIDSAGGSGVYLSNSDNVSVFDNFIVDSSNNNIYSSSSEFNTIYENEITRASSYGIRLNQCNDHLIYHNNLYLNSIANANVVGSSINYWDNGYPMGGNYWDDHNASDNYFGPGQNLTGYDGVGYDGVVDGNSPDPYVISGENKDWYPFIEPYDGRNASEWNYFPQIINETPLNKSIDISIFLENVSIDVFDDEGENFTVNISGTFINNQTYSNVGNGTYNASILTPLDINTTYTWEVNITGIGTYKTYNHTVFTFTTANPQVEPPSVFTVDAYNSTRLDFYWEKGTDATHTYIIYNTEDYPSNRTDGTVVANYTWDGSAHLDGLTHSTTYYFKAWGYNETYNMWSTSNVTAMNTTKTPQIELPTDFKATTFTESQINLTWVKGSNSSHTYIRYSNSTYPTDKTEGDLLCNTTLNHYEATGLEFETTYYFTVWTWSETHKLWSISYIQTSNTTFPESVAPYVVTASPNNTLTNTTPVLEVTVFDGNNDLINVSFYWGNHTLIGYRETHDTASILDIGILNHNQSYGWYVNLSDGTGQTNHSSFSFDTCKDFDLNSDGVVDYLDVSALVAHYLDSVNPPGSEPWDINNDGTVNYLDISILVTHYGESYD